MKRTQVKKTAALKWEQAQELGNVDEMKKYASRTAVLTKEMIHDAQQVITALGLPIVQAPSEGEAQTAHMVSRGDAFASVSQDYDNLIFGCPLLLRNLSIEGRRKQPGKLAYVIVKPELIALQEVLQTLHMTLDQLIVTAILVGTDYNPGGIKGIGPKTAVKLVQEHDTSMAGFEQLFKEVAWEKHNPDTAWNEIFGTIKDMPVRDDYALAWKPINLTQLQKLLIDEHDFSEERVRKKMDVLGGEQKKKAQSGLSEFFGGK